MTTNKLLIGVGAFAFAAAASLTPLVAQADPASDTDSSASADAGSVGNAAGRKPARATRASVGNAQAPQAQTPQAPQAPQATVNGARAAGPGAQAFGSNPLIQNPLWWFGTPNAAAPTPIYTNTFKPLASLPDWALGYYGWYRDLNFEACVLGLSSTITPSVGPYGTSTSSISTGGC